MVPFSLEIIMSVVEAALCFVGLVAVVLVVTGALAHDPDRKRRQASRRIMDRNRAHSIAQAERRKRRYS